MKLSKFLIVSCFLFVGAFTADAACTVTTRCGTFTYDATNISVSASVGGGMTTITVKSGGVVLDTIQCRGNSARASVSCQGSSGDSPNEPGDDEPGGGFPDFDICDRLPDFVKRYFGCD